ncbi:TonB-dependent receptor plug domain-containing protein [Mucilaginibacter mali]|uniref:TonB-dependent receptor plug domain-containing protein n=1 Tax=Mucilaginibacter mali TaxID=2740462 RepID=A0A7D4UJS9_9SPHI|nr:carboxypeptidase-like regulatory domain-containing protein [Mucilaginibacter mali]QKJ29562.1 TonB-dependent receptor plug domain-containing protein [Mucilaginibacter mali]
MKTFTICVKLLTALSIVILLAFSPADDLLDALLAKIEKRAADYPQEKIHLHLDKPYYSIGEDMWFKAYVVDAAGNMLSDRSKILYIDLLDDRDSVKQTLLLPLMNGTASGNVHLNDSLLSAGKYHICAYTKWMQNFGSEYFFRKDISIVNALKGVVNSASEKRINNKNLATVADVQFFPEGGHLVSGIRTKIGFKALKPDGLGEDISGYIVEEGSTGHVADFKSEHAGMGVFALMPVTGKSYNAIIKHADGSEKRYPLPKADESGYVLNMNHVGADSLSVKISTSTGLIADKEAILIAQCNGIVKLAAKPKLDNTGNLSYISTKKFPTGIVQFTLFSPEMKPVAERLVFVQHNDQLSADVKTDKPEYPKRGKVNIGLDVTNVYEEAVIGSFSVAVTDEGKVSTDENNETTILSNLLLTSDIKGYIEQPNYYFNLQNPDRSKYLDLLLLTQGWRRFSWADLLTDKYPAIKYQPEQSLAVTGSVLTLGNKPVPKAKVNLIARSGGGLIMLNTVADDQGHFAFTGLDIADSTKVMVKATRANNGTQVKTVIDRKPRLNYAGNYSALYINSTGLDNYLQQTRNQFTEMSKLGLIKNAIALKEVNIKAVRERDKFTMAKMIPHSSNLDPGNADYVIKQDKLEQETYLTDALATIPGLEVKKNGIYSTRASSLGGAKPMAIILDGARIPAGVMSSINPFDLAGIEVLVGASRAIYGSEGSSGVIIITTKRGGENDSPPNIFNIAHYTPQGYAAVKQFYSPAYDTPNQTKMADLRSTIYWNPDVVTGSDGKANFSFYNADGTGTYKVTIEGMDTKGGLLRKTFTYVVK